MPPVVAAILTAALIIALFVRESRHQAISPALWIAIVWLLVTGSRFVSQWLSLGSVADTQFEDGSPIDAAFFLLCILASSAVLIRRRVAVIDLIRNNKWLAALFLFGLLSVLWSDFHFIAFKRWIKILGHPLVALVILTDPNPRQAVIAVMKRCTYLLLPVSVLFIKYYPEFGRGFDAWSGEAFNQGVGLNKNYLGNLSMTFGLFFVWYLLTVRKLDSSRFKTTETGISIVFILMALWLLGLSDSATSVATMIIGIAIIFGLGSSLVNKRYVGTYFVVGAILAFVVEVGFNAHDRIVQMLGRDPTLTDRHLVWADTLALQPNILLGAGFESFWLGNRLDVLWEKWWWMPNQAHNGYIETYLNLGLIGVFLLLGLLISTFRRVCRSLIDDLDFGRWRLAMLFAIAFYNYTEATFKGVHFLFTIFCIIAIEYSVRDRRESGLRHDRQSRVTRAQNVRAKSRRLQNSSV